MDRREVPLSSMATLNAVERGRLYVQGLGLASPSDHVSLVLVPVDHPHCLPLVVTFPCLCRSACLLPVFPFRRNGNSLYRMCFGRSASLYLIQGNVSAFGSQGNISPNRHDKKQLERLFVSQLLAVLGICHVSAIEAWSHTNKHFQRRRPASILSGLARLSVSTSQSSLRRTANLHVLTQRGFLFDPQQPPVVRPPPVITSFWCVL